MPLQRQWGLSASQTASGLGPAGPALDWPEESPGIASSQLVGLAMKVKLLKYTEYMQRICTNMHLTWQILNSAHKKQLSFCRYLYESGDEHDKCSGPASTCMNPLTFFDLLVWQTIDRQVQARLFIINSDQNLFYFIDSHFKIVDGALP